MAVLLTKHHWFSQHIFQISSTWKHNAYKSSTKDLILEAPNMGNLIIFYLQKWVVLNTYFLDNVIITAYQI